MGSLSKQPKIFWLQCASNKKCLITRHSSNSPKRKNSLVRKALDRENERLDWLGGHYSSMIHGHALRKSIAQWSVSRGEPRLEVGSRNLGRNEEKFSTRMQKKVCAALAFRKARILMQRLSQVTKTVLSSNNNRNRKFLPICYSPRKWLVQRPVILHSPVGQQESPEHKDKGLGNRSCVGWGIVNIWPRLVASSNSIFSDRVRMEIDVYDVTTQDNRTFRLWAIRA